MTYTETERSAPRLPRLIREVIELDEVVQRSRLDSDLQRDGHYSFVYMIDPDVVEFFIHPNRWVETVAALPSLYSPSGPHEPLSAEPDRDDDHNLELGEDKEALEAAALLTSEFIFSDKMVGSDDKLLVGPDHMTDFLGHLNRIERGFTLPLKRQVEKRQNLFRDLKRTLQVNSDDDPSNNNLRSVRDIVIKELAEISQSELLAPMRLRRLMERNILRNAQCNPAFDQSIVAPPRNEVREFEKRIRIAKRRNPVVPSREAIESDAVTLCQLTQLNRDWRQTKRVFLLVTRDSGLKSAYWDWVDEQKRAGIPEENLFFPLRHPRQFIPILNMRDMPGVFEDPSVFETVGRAIETIVGLFARGSSAGRSSNLWGGRIPSVIDLRNTLPSEGQIDGELLKTLNEQIDAIGQAWMSLVRYAVAAKSDILSNVALEENKYWHEFATGSALREIFRTQTSDFERRVDQLSVSSVMLRYEVWAIRIVADHQPNSQGDDYGRRAIASQFCEFKSDLFKNQTLSDILSKLSRDPNRAIETLRRTRGDERLFVSGALCLDIGAWAAAMSLLSKVEKELSRGAENIGLRNEVQFFSSVAARLSAKASSWADRYQEAEYKLNELLRTEKDTFRRARLFSEMFALYVSALAWGADTKRATPPTEFRQMQTMDALVLLHEEFSSTPLFSGAAQNGWTPLRNQVCLNTLCLFYWSRALEMTYEAKLLRAYVEFELSRVDELLASGGRGHAKIYPDMARVFLHAQRDETAVARVISKIRTILETERDDHFAFDLPPIDKTEYDKVILMLSSP